MNEVTETSNPKQDIIRTTILLFVFFVLIILFLIILANQLRKENELQTEWYSAIKKTNEMSITYISAEHMKDNRYHKNNVYLPKGRPLTPEYNVHELHFKEFKHPFYTSIYYDFFKDSVFTMKHYEFQKKKCILNISAKHNNKEFIIYSNDPVDINTFAEMHCYDNLEQL